MVLLFLLSLVLITAGFWTTRLTIILPVDSREGFEAAEWLLQLLGMGLNIGVLPYFTSCLVSIPLSRAGKVLTWGWNTLFILLALSVFLFPRITLVPLLISLQQVLTILGALIFLGVGLRRPGTLLWRKAMTVFLIVSGGFLLLLVMDMLITLLPIPALARLDNMSLPVYLTVLTLGTFFFAGRFLSREALVKAGRLTEEGRKFYNLSAREIEIIEELISGYSNKEIGERLFISPKTVENHLYNIYQKMDVGSRTQLIGTLRSWEREA